MKNIDLNLSTLAEGGVQEKIDRELKKIMANILDPNTKDTKRKLQVNITFDPNEKRNSIETTVDIKSTLAPQLPAMTTVLVGRDMNTGQVQAAELKSGAPGQTYIDPDDGLQKTDTGVPIDEIDDSVVDFNKMRKQNKN